MNFIKLFLALSLITMLSVSCKKDVKVSFSDENIKYSGRTDISNNDDAALFYWSGTSVKINFKGNAIYAELKDETGDNYYNIILDEDSVVVLRPDSTKKHYLLASGLSDKEHSIEIFKRTEWDRGRTCFFGFKIEGNAELLPKDEIKKKKIEFYGNSITAGYGVEDYSGNDSPDSIYTNNYLSYSAVMARHYNAEYQCICRSGIGIMISWFPVIMPEIYNRINPKDSLSLWDFSLYTPDVVVVNLFQNDAWLVNMPEFIEFKNTFDITPPNDFFIINAYKEFVSTIRGHYPNADIICALGNMDITQEGSVWPDYVKSAVELLNDEKIHYCFVPYKESDGHPKIEEQQLIANSLIEFIDSNIDW